MVTSAHSSAESIYEEVRRSIPHVGLATVYRNLRLLRDRGKIVELRTYHGVSRYDGNTSVHYHFCCTRCGKFIDLDEPVDAAIEERVARSTGLKVTGHELQVTGLCLDCQHVEAVEGHITSGLEKVLIAEVESARDVQQPLAPGESIAITAPGPHEQR